GGREFTAAPRPASRPCPMPASVSEISGWRVYRPARFPSLSPWRRSSRRPTTASALLVQPVDQAAAEPERGATRRENEPGQVVELRLGLVLLGKRVAQLDPPLCDERREVAGQRLAQGWRYRTGQPDHPVAADVPRRVVDAVEGRDLLDRLADAGRGPEERQVLLVDEAAPEQVVVHVLQPGFPVRPARRVEEHDRYRVHLAGLRQRQRLVALVVGAEPAREEHDRVRFLHEHELAGEEVAEGDELRVVLDELVRVLLEGEPDVDAEAPLASRPLLAGAHDAVPAAGDDHVAPGGDLARELCRGAVRRLSGRR